MEKSWHIQRLIYEIDLGGQTLSIYSNLHGIENVKFIKSF